MPVDLTAIRPIWILVSPDYTPDIFDDEAEARAEFEWIADSMREEAGDGWHEGAESLALYRAHPVLSLKLKHTAEASDDTEDGERCRAAGWDFIAEGVTVDHGTLDVDALRAERDALAAEVKRLTDRLEVFAGALLSLGASS